MAYNWAIALLAISVSILLNTPHSVDHSDPNRAFLYDANIYLACLSFIVANALIYYSVLSHPGAKLAKVQKTDRQIPPPPPDLPTLPDGPLPNEERDYKRVNKMTYNWAIALLAISVSILLNTPHSVDHSDPNRAFLYGASVSLAYLSLIAAVVLIYYSVLSHPSAKLAKEQKRMMFFSAVTLVLAVFSHLALFIPFPLYLQIMESMILLTGLLLLLIYLAHKFKLI